MVPKSPQQNGVSEHLNRTLAVMTRSMLAGSGLPQKLWAETLLTVRPLRKKPDVGHIRAFGCVCYALIAKDERKKLDVVARRCVLVGYGNEVKVYRLYDPDVWFNESEVDFKESSVVEPVELEVDDS